MKCIKCIYQGHQPSSQAYTKCLKLSTFLKMCSGWFPLQLSMASNNFIKLLWLCKLNQLRYDGKCTCARLVLGIPPLTYFRNLNYKYLVSTSYKCACFGNTYTKIGTIQRRLAWLPCARMTRKIVKRSTFFGPDRWTVIVIVTCFACMWVRRFHIHHSYVPDFRVQNDCLELLWSSLANVDQWLSKRPSLNSLITLLKRCVSQKQPKDCELSCWPMKAVIDQMQWQDISRHAKTIKGTQRQINTPVSRSVFAFMRPHRLHRHHRHHRPHRPSVFASFVFF